MAIGPANQCRTNHAKAPS